MLMIKRRSRDQFGEGNSNCDGSYHQNANNSTVLKLEDNRKVIDHSKIDQDNDDDDFKLPKKKYRMVCVC